MGVGEPAFQFWLLGGASSFVDFPVSEKVRAVSQNPGFGSVSLTAVLLNLVFLPCYMIPLKKMLSHSNQSLSSFPGSRRPPPIQHNPATQHDQSGAALQLDGVQQRSAQAHAAAVLETIDLALGALLAEGPAAVQLGGELRVVVPGGAT